MHVRKWFAIMGSQEINRIKYREGFVFIGYYKERSQNERRGNVHSGTVSVAQIFSVPKNLESKQIKITKFRSRTSLAYYKNNVEFLKSL